MTRARFFLWFVTWVSLAGGSGCGVSQEKERELAKHEESAPELFKKGESAAAGGDMTRAEQYLVAALRAGGKEKPIVQRLLFVCVADQRYPVALEYAEQYLHRHPQDTDLLFAAASLHAAVGDTPGARARLETVTRQRPEWAEAHYAFATVLREDDFDVDRADEHDLAYLKLNPTGPLAEAARARLSRGPQ
jgi:outer membrane protein assembly factor BamD (BamD/ComL family)